MHQSFLYKFLLAPQFRAWRYLSLILFFTIVSLNQAFIGYLELVPHIGNNIYWIIPVTVLVYVVTIYLLNKFFLQYLLNGRYLLFTIYLLLCAVVFTTVSVIVYNFYIDDYNFFSKVTIIDNLSALVIYILCIPGVIIPVFLRNWLLSNQYLNQLKLRQASSQVEQFKEQINPVSFFRVLNKSKCLVKTEPDKASAMLMKLGQLLRYQLYDCNRKQVLVTAEVSFLQYFLELERLCSPGFNYTIEIEGNINGCFVSPSILLPYVRSAINSFDNEKEARTIAIRLSNTDDSICIMLHIAGVSGRVLLDTELLKAKERLDALYEDNYELVVAGEESDEKIRVSLRLNKK